MNATKDDGFVQRQHCIQQFETAHQSCVGIDLWIAVVDGRVEQCANEQAIERPKTVHLDQQQGENAAEEQRYEQKVDARESRAEDADGADDDEADRDLMPGVPEAKPSYGQTQGHREGHHSSCGNQRIRSSEVWWHY